MQLSSQIAGLSMRHGCWHGERCLFWVLTTISIIKRTSERTWWRNTQKENIFRFRKASRFQNHVNGFPRPPDIFLLSNVLQIHHDSNQGHGILCHMVSSHQRRPKELSSRGCLLYIYRGPAWQSWVAHSHESHIRTAEDIWACFPACLYESRTMSDVYGQAVQFECHFHSRASTHEEVPKVTICLPSNSGKWYADGAIITSLILFVRGISRHILHFKHIICSPAVRAGAAVNGETDNKLSTLKTTLCLIKWLLFDFGAYEVRTEDRKKTWILIDYALNTLSLKTGQCAGQSEKVGFTNGSLDVSIRDKASFLFFLPSFPGSERKNGCLGHLLSG